MQKTSPPNALINAHKTYNLHHITRTMRPSRWLGLLGALIIASGCSNHLYQGTTNYHYAGKTCQAHVSWTNTTHVFDPVGEPSDVVIRMASTQHGFQFTHATIKNDDALTLLLPASEYADVINNSTGTTDTVCAVFEGADAHMQQATDVTYLSFYCEKKSREKKSREKQSPKSANVESHMQARKAPYVVKMQKPITETSLFANAIKSNLGQPDCRVSNGPASRTDK